jgi:tRNA threonylcarbamoyladenosine biosynthesis protein TsaE
MLVTKENLGATASAILADVAVQERCVLALHGELGAGKTTFVAALAKELGVAEPVISPTFIIYRVYETAHTRFKALVHIDAYRLEGSVDALKIRLNELFLQPDTLVCIEWPEHIGEALPKDALHVYFTYHSDTQRDIAISKS